MSKTDGNILGLQQHELLAEVIRDGEEVFRSKKINIFALNLPDLEFNEYEYYIHGVGFSLVHLIALYGQLGQAVIILDNYHYSRKMKAAELNRAKHLIYNVENYFIRVQSVKDRLYQLINKVFHLCITESEVRQRVVMTNYKVSRTKVSKVVDKLEKYLNTYSKDRNTIVHKHSMMDLELRTIELMYMKNDLDNRTKRVRSALLRETIASKVTQFKNINENIATLSAPVFDELLKEYKNTRTILHRIALE